MNMAWHWHAHMCTTIGWWLALKSRILSALHSKLVMHVEYLKISKIISNEKMSIHLIIYLGCTSNHIIGTSNVERNKIK
jgi:hypothetical protein